jgi:hypothetical protein
MCSGRIFVSVVLLASILWQKDEATSPPATAKHPIVDEYHGVKVTDDYRWLEDGKSPNVIAWTAAQTKYAQSLLDPFPLHTAIYQYMKKLASARRHRLFGRSAGRNRHVSLRIHV